jgi:signal transduction histidine kinase
MVSYISVIWSAAASATLLLGILHVLVWGYDRRAVANLGFAIASLGLAAGSFIELAMLRAETPQRWGELVWWMHIPLFLLVCGMAVFLRLYLDAGRLWPKRVALVIGGPVLAAVTLSLVLTQLVIWRSAELPMLLIPPFFIAVVAISLEVSRDVVRDVTAQRRAEDEVSELRRKLAHAGRVTALGQLSAALAHEISQPLSAIQQNGETAQLLFAREPLDIEELRAIIDDIVRDNRRATEVVQRMRKWLKQGHMHREAVCLELLVQDVLPLVRLEASAKHITVECAVLRGLPPVYGDHVHLSQVLLNLVMNAMDASVHASEVGRRVSIAASVIAASGCCEVSVSDTGAGIPPDQLSRIFEPFFTSKSDGMGIGLSISHAIVEAHGGKLWAENAVRGGATFYFTVPLHADELRIPA